MTKFRVKLKLTGLELDVKGSREDVPLVTKNIAQQMASMMMPAASIVEGKATPMLTREPIEARVGPQPAEAPVRSTRKQRRPSGAGACASNGAVGPIVWQHDANTWGSPMQTWKAVDKVVWLLYVAKQAGVANEMTAHQMVTSFDRLFRTSGKLNRGNIARDVAKINSEPPPKVQTNGTVEPPTYYLTDAGNRHAENLVKAARGEAVTRG